MPLKEIVFVKGGNASVIFSRGGNALIQFLVVLYYGSVFSPSEFGELSILMIVIGLSYGLLDLGTTNTVITLRVNGATCRMLQAINFVVGVIVGACLLLVSFIQPDLLSYSGGFYDALKYTAPLFLVYSLTIVPYARLHKALKLKQLAFVDFFPVLSLVFTVPTLFSFGFGLSTLVVSIAVQVCVRFLVLRYFYGPMVRFGRSQKVPVRILFRQYASNLVVYLTSKLDQIMVATFLSPDAFGVYSFLKQILNYPISILIAIYTQITFPYFSKYRRSLNKIRKLLFSSAGIFTGVITLYFVVILGAPTKFMSEYIPMWDFRTEVALLLILLSFSRICIEVLSSMAIAVGFIGRQLYINTVFLVITFLCGLGIPIFGLNYYLLLLSSSAFVISILICVTTFRRLNDGKNSSIHSI